MGRFKFEKRSTIYLFIVEAHLMPQMYPRSRKPHSSTFFMLPAPLERADLMDHVDNFDGGSFLIGSIYLHGGLIWSINSMTEFYSDMV
jgi:hypothetical protein